jgi:hypothetical protein
VSYPRLEDFQKVADVVDNIDRDNIFGGRTFWVRSATASSVDTIRSDIAEELLEEISEEATPIPSTPDPERAITVVPDADGATVSDTTGIANNSVDETPVAPSLPEFNSARPEHHPARHLWRQDTPPHSWFHDFPSPLDQKS